MAQTHDDYLARVFGIDPTQYRSPQDASDATDAAADTTQPADPSDSGAGSPVQLSSAYPDPNQTEAGSTDSGATDAGPTDTGDTEAGSTDAGATDSDSTGAGGSDASQTDSGDTDTDIDQPDPGQMDPGQSDPSQTDPNETDPSTDPLALSGNKPPAPKPSSPGGGPAPAPSTPKPAPTPKHDDPDPPPPGPGTPPPGGRTTTIKSKVEVVMNSMTSSDAVVTTSFSLPGDEALLGTVMLINGSYTWGGVPINPEGKTPPIDPPIVDPGPMQLSIGLLSNSGQPVGRAAGAMLQGGVKPLPTISFNNVNQGRGYTIQFRITPDPPDKPRGIPLHVKFDIALSTPGP